MKKRACIAPKITETASGAETLGFLAQIALPGLFTTGADIVDFNNLTAAQDQLIQATPASIYNGLGGDDIVTLPNVANYNESIGNGQTLNWNPSLTFATGSLAGQVYSVTAGDGNYNIALGAGSDTVTITGNGANNITAGTGTATINLNGTGTDTITTSSGQCNINLGALVNTVNIIGTGNSTITCGTGIDKISISGTGSNTLDIIDGFSAGDIIDLTNVAATSETYNASTGVLSLLNNDSTVGSLTIPGNFTSLSFGMAKDGSVGTDIELNTEVTVSDGDATFDLAFNNLDDPTPDFEAGVEQAAAILSSTIENDITINLMVGYGTYPGDLSTVQAGVAEAAPAQGATYDYSAIRSDLIAAGAPGASSLPDATSINGQSQVEVWSAEEKALGLPISNDIGIDGYAGFATDIPGSQLVGVALHELTHAMGRYNSGPTPDIFDFYRYTSTGNRLFTGGATASAAYFSLDGGNTKIADYGQTSDASDFLNTPGSSVGSIALTPNDPFDEFYGATTLQYLTPVDDEQLAALGFNLVIPDPLFTNTPSLASSTPTSVTLGGTIDPGDVGLTISIYDGTTLLGTTTANASGAWSATETVSAQGVHTLTEQATNAVGGTGISSPVTDLVQASTSLSGGGQIVLFAGTGDAVTLSATAGVADTVTGSGGTVTLSNAQATVTGTDAIALSGTSALTLEQAASGTISGFAPGDILDLANTVATSATPGAFDSAANTTPLTVTLSNSSTLTFTLAGNYSGDAFNVALVNSSADTDITLNAAGALAGSVTLTKASEGVALASGTQVATFTDSNTSDPASNFTASIAFGDGTTAAGTVTGSAGNFTVSTSAAHTYADEGSDTLSVTVTPKTGSALALSGTVAVAESDVLAAITTGQTFSANAGQVFDASVSFSDTGYPTNSTSDFTATINWGDGTPATAGTITNTDGTFTVAGSHTYAAGGSDTMTVTLSDDAPGTATATATNTINVAAGALTGAVTLSSASEGVALASGTQVATFTDSNTSDTATNFTATINFGDGTTAAGTVTGSNGNFTVTTTAAHTYADEGSDTLSVTVTPKTGSPLSLSGTVAVAESDVLAAITTGQTFSATAGQVFDASVSFSDTGYPGNSPSDFTATINWGDGTTGTGTVTGSNGTFTVTGTHTYAAGGSDTMTVTLSDDSPGTATATATNTVSVAAQSGVIAWKSPVSGSWNTASNWNPATIPGAGSQAAISGTGTYTVTSSQSNTVGSLNISDRHATLAITGSSTFTLGTLQASSNSGTISINEGSTLNIGGTLGNQGVLQSTDPANGPFAKIENGTVDNGAVVEAAGGSTLVLSQVTIDNLFPTASYPGGGAIKTTLGSQVDLDNATVIGGTLGSPQANLLSVSLAGQGTLIETMSGSQSNVLDGTASPLSNDAYLLMNDNSSLTLKGTITNGGVIDIDPNTHPTKLQISGSVTLNGGGELILSNQNSSIVGTGPGASLTNVNDTIVGAGSIGGSLKSLVNQGAIESTDGPLTVNTGSNAISNTGTLASIGGDLIADSPVTGTGADQISQGGTLEFGASVASGQTIAFSGTGDTLLLDHAESFMATVAGLAAASRTSFDAIDLADFKFADTKITNVSGSSAKGATTNITLTDSLDHLATTIQLLNQYAGQFAVNANAYSLTSANPASPAAGTIFSVDHTLGVPNRGIGH